MIFKHTVEQVLNGTKTQTRRVVKFNQCGVPPGHVDSFTAVEEQRFDGRWWLKYEVGRTYAVQPGCNQKAVGRIRITAIRQESVQDITEADARAEGVAPDYCNGRVDPERIYTAGFIDLWNAVQYSNPTRAWENNPLVWVLEFKLIDSELLEEVEEWEAASDQGFVDFENSLG